MNIMFHNQLLVYHGTNEYCSVNYQIISPRENKPIIAIVQVLLLGINKLTKGETITHERIGVDSYYSQTIQIFINKEEIRASCKRKC